MHWLRAHFSAGLLILSLVALAGCGGKGGDDESESSGSGSSTVSGPSTLKPSQQAVLAFELNFEEMMESEVGQAMLTEDALQQWNAGPESEVVMSIKKISGYISSPENMNDLVGFVMFGGLGMEGLPVEFMVEVEYIDADVGKMMNDQMMLGAMEVEVDGRQMFTPADDGAPPVFFEIVSDTKTRVGSETYLTTKSGLVTDSLGDHWNKLPSDGVRVAVDLDGARELLDAMTEEMRPQAPAWANPLIDVIDQASFLSLVVQPDNNDLVELLIEGKTATDAQDIKTVLGGLLDLAKLMAGGSIRDMKETTPKMAEVAEAVLKDLSAQVSGREVSIVVKKPDGLEEALQEAMEVSAETGFENSASNDLFQLGLAVHNYHDVHRALPFDATEGEDGLSWRVRVLPFVEETNLYDQFDLDAAWDSDQNRPLATEMPFIYAAMQGSDFENSSVVYVRPNSPITSLDQVRDGTSQTIMLMETTNPVPWTQKKDITIDEAVAMVVALAPGDSLAAVRYDASRISLTSDMDVDELRAMLDPDDGN